ncbi:MROH9 isoform 3, partial [Pongo abelii]
MPLAASQALCTFLPLGSYKKAVAQFFPQLLTTLIFQVFYSSELKPILKDRTLYAQDALRVLLNCSGLQQVDITLMKENFWDQLSEDLCYYHGVCFIAKTLSEYNFPQFPETLRYLYKLSVEGPRRSEDTVIIVIFLTELLNNFFQDPLPEEFLVLFTNWINDSNPVVSRLILHRIVHMSPIINKVD